MKSPLSLLTQSFNPFRTRVVIGCIVLLGVISLSGLYMMALSDVESVAAASTDVAAKPEPTPEKIRSDRVDGHLPYPRQLFDIKSTIKVKKPPTATIFMFRGDFSSPYTDIFALHKRATKICDKDTKFGGCDIKLEKNYKWGTLSNKLVDTLTMYCNYPEDKKTDFYVKVDDDLIMPESKLDEILQKMAETPCQYAGGMQSHFSYYWVLGQMYIIKRSIFDDICKKLPTYKVTRPDAEDITMGDIIDCQDFNAVCELNRPDNHWHIDYEDQRVKIEYHKQHNE